jgi:hypothetical protein
VGTPTKNPKSIMDDFASRQNVHLVPSMKAQSTPLRNNRVSSAVTQDTTLWYLLNATYSYVHPHEITMGKTVGIPHENRGSSPLWATAYLHSSKIEVGWAGVRCHPTRLFTQSGSRVSTLHPTLFWSGIGYGSGGCLLPCKMTLICPFSG